MSRRSVVLLDNIYNDQISPLLWNWDLWPQEAPQPKKQEEKKKSSISNHSGDRE